MAAASYGLPPHVDIDLDTAYTEETLRQAKNFADQVYADATTPGSHVHQSDIEALCDALYRLGLHLDHAHGFNVTGGPS